MDKFIEGFDRQFAQLHSDSHKLIHAISPALLYHQPPGKSNSLPLHSCGEHVLRSAAVVEQTENPVWVLTGTGISAKDFKSIADKLLVLDL